MLNYEKYYGKKVLLNCDGIYFGRVATLLGVVPSEWGLGTSVAHVSIENSVAIVLPVEELIILKEEK